MQIVFLSEWLTILFCFVLWAILPTFLTFLCMTLPDRYFSPNRFFFRSHRWENGGEVYNRLFRVKRWKHLLPDGAAVVKGGYKKKRLTDFSESNLRKFLVESCRAELLHVLVIALFWVFGFFVPPNALFYMFLYALATNFPCVIVQRYNRPRIIALLTKRETKRSA